MIGIIDYGAGNLRSVKKAIDFLNIDNVIIQSPADFTTEIEKVILPGVGSFGAAVDTLKARDLYAPVRNG